MDIGSQGIIREEKVIGGRLLLQEAFKEGLFLKPHLNTFYGITCLSSFSSDHSSVLRGDLFQAIITMCSYN